MPATAASGYPRGRDERGKAHSAVQACRSCKAPMRWVAMPSGKRNPLDAAPSNTAGNVIVLERGDWAIGVVLHSEGLIAEARELGFPLYTSHFATCPDSDDHRRPRERRDLA